MSALVVLKVHIMNKHLVSFTNKKNKRKRVSSLGYDLRDNILETHFR